MPEITSTNIEGESGSTLDTEAAAPLATEGLVPSAGIALELTTLGGLGLDTQGGLEIVTQGTQIPPAVIPTPPPVYAVGSQGDILNRLQMLQPPGWFSAGAVPIRDALLTGVANALSYVYSLFAYLKLQTRIATATDGFLDMIAGDYFGEGLQREPNQSDASYKSRIQASLTPERNTRLAIIKVLTLITGKAPTVFEPQRPADTGAYNVAANLAYNVAGGYGSPNYPYQCFVTATRPVGSGIPLVAGYGIPTGAYNTPSRAVYVNLSELQSNITDSDIYQAIESVRLASTIVWTQIHS